MKRSLLSLLVAAALPLSATAQVEATPTPTQDAEKAEAKKPKVYKIGTQVPADLRLKDIDGNELTMKELRGKIVVIAWYAIYCPGIKATEDRLKAMAKKYDEGKEVVLIAINSDKGELSDARPVGLDKDGKPLKPFPRIRGYMKDKEINFRMFVDPGNKVADLFQAKTTPHMFVLDPKGVVRYSGALDNDMSLRKEKEDYVHYVDQAISAIKAKQEVTTTTTKPYG